MFHIAQPTIADLTQADVDELRQYADREIAAGRYVQAERLRTLLACYQSANENSFEDLLHENEAIAKELHSELLLSQKDVEDLDSKIVGVVDELDELLAQKLPMSWPSTGTVEASRQFHGALTEIHKTLAQLSERFKKHVEDANTAATPVEELKTEKKT